MDLLRATRVPALIWIISVTSVSFGSDSRPTLDFETRVRAQEAIERVYHRHRTEGKLPFGDLVDVAQDPVFHRHRHLVLGFVVEHAGELPPGQG